MRCPHRRQTVRVIAGIRRTVKRTNIVKVAAKTAVYSVVPSTLNDVFVHHANMSIGEIQNVATDTVAIGIMSAVIKTLIQI